MQTTGENETSGRQIHDIHSTGIPYTNSRISYIAVYQGYVLVLIKMIIPANHICY
jgi:hypothetical protein